MGKKSKVNGDRRERFSRVRKVIRCSCKMWIEVFFTRGLASMLVIEHHIFVTDKGRTFNCSACGASHDADKEGEEGTMATVGMVEAS